MTTWLLSGMTIYVIGCSILVWRPGKLLNVWTFGLGVVLALVLIIEATLVAYERQNVAATAATRQVRPAASEVKQPIGHALTISTSPALTLTLPVYPPPAPGDICKVSSSLTLECGYHLAPGSALIEAKKP